MRADWTTHHIQGYARAAMERGMDGAFSAPLISHIDGNLYVGGCIDGVPLTDDFRYVVSLYPWEKYQLAPGTQRREIVMYDAGEMPNLEQLHEAADHVVACLEKGQTLVHCQAGLNRSNLVSALALIKMGRQPTDAIALLREKRSPMVLCNETFEEWLLAQQQEDVA